MAAPLPFQLRILLFRGVCGVLTGSVGTLPANCLDSLVNVGAVARFGVILGGHPTRPYVDTKNPTDGKHPEISSVPAILCASVERSTEATNFGDSVPKALGFIALTPE
jgi:hypothetical protein